jgi:predicted nucleotidyltransferase
VKPQFEKILPALVAGGVEFIVVGGFAGIVHGAARTTFDVDLVYARTRMNIDRLVAVLAPHSPVLRDAPAELPFILDVTTVRNGLNFTLRTRLGDVDLFGEIGGGQTYDDLLTCAIEIEAFEVRFKCIDLAGLIRLKEKAGRPKDLEAIAELRVLLEEGRNSS